MHNFIFILQFLTKDGSEMLLALRTSMFPTGSSAGSISQGESVSRPSTLPVGNKLVLVGFCFEASFVAQESYVIDNQ